MSQMKLPSNTNSREFDPDVDDVLEDFFALNPDAYSEQVKKDIDNEQNEQSDTDFSNITENLIPGQDGIIFLGTEEKKFARVYADEYRDENGNLLPYITTLDTITGDNVIAEESKETILLRSSDTTISINGNNSTKTVDLNVKRDTIQAKTTLTIGPSAYNDYVVDMALPNDAFNNLINDLAGSSDHTTVCIEDGVYNFNATIVIPNDINTTWQATTGNVSLISSATTTVQIGGTSAPFSNYYQTFKGISFERVDIYSSPNVLFSDCIFSKLVVGNASATISFYPVKFDSCYLFGLVDITDIWNVMFNNCFLNANNVSPFTINESQNITWTGGQILYIGAPITLTDSVGNPTARIVFNGVTYENYGSTVNFITDSRTNVSSTKLYMTGVQTGIAVSAGTYHNPGTNYINVI